MKYVFLLLNDMIYLIKNMCKIFEGKKCVKDLIINLIVFDVLKLSLIIVYLLVYMLFDIFEIFNCIFNLRFFMDLGFYLLLFVWCMYEYFFLFK